MALYTLIFPELERQNQEDPGLASYFLGEFQANERTCLQKQGG